MNESRSHTAPWKLQQQTLWPIFDDERKLADDYLRDLVVANGIPEKFADNATLTAFSSGEVRVSIAFDLSAEETRYLASLGGVED
jgi:hypothetical protein